jgi:hypothetical protein
MDGEEEKSKAFKVEDRRRFSAEGELKPEHRGVESEAAASPAATSPEGTQPRAHGAAGGADQKGAAAAPGSRSAAPPTSSRAAPDSGGEITFASFMVGISTQALVHLGEIQDPQSEHGPAATSIARSRL